MDAFKAIVVDKTEGGQSVSVRDFDDADLMDGDVTVRVTHSTLNYKDGLALTGKAPVVRRFPMIPGIDFAGVVESSSHPDFKPGDRVVLNGWGTGETHLGAYGEKSRVKGDWLIPLPEGLSPEQAMAVGTAGYTAMLAVLALEMWSRTRASGAGSSPRSGDRAKAGARRPRPHGRWHLDEMIVRAGGKQMYLWRAVDAEVLDVLLQAKCDTKAARNLMRKLLKRQDKAPDE